MRRTYKHIRGSLSRGMNALLDRPVTLSKSPTFIVGCGHSGTTLMLGLIGRHPSFHMISYESGIFHPWNRMEAIRAFFKEKEAEAGDKRILEKTPRHVKSLDRIFRIFPDARVVAMVRDGRDVACSMLRRNIPLKKGIRRWINDCAHIERWRRDERVFVVKYEELVHDQIRVLEELFAFLGEETHTDHILSTDKKVEFQFSPSLDLDSLSPEEYEIRTKHNKRRNDQINKAIYDGRGEWKKVLDTEQTNYIQDVAAASLSAWGY